MSAIHGKAGRLEEARFAAGELLKLHPDFADWAWKEMEARSIGPELAAAMAGGWRAAGAALGRWPQAIEAAQSAAPT